MVSALKQPTLSRATKRINDEAEGLYPKPAKVDFTELSESDFHSYLYFKVPLYGLPPEAVPRKIKLSLGQIVVSLLGKRIFAKGGTPTPT